MTIRAIAASVMASLLLTAPAAHAQEKNGTAAIPEMSGLWLVQDPGSGSWTDWFDNVPKPKLQPDIIADNQRMAASEAAGNVVNRAPRTAACPVGNLPMMMASSPPLNIVASRDATMLSGGEEAIIIGRLPTGHAAVRGMRLTTFPAASLAAILWLSATMSGWSCGFGTLSNHSAQLPEPGSCKIHRPDISAAGTAPFFSCACASGVANRTLITIPAAIGLRVILSSRSYGFTVKANNVSPAATSTYWRPSTM